MKPGFFSLTFGYGEKINKWRKEPTGIQQDLKLKYSINRNAVYVDYRTTFYQLLGKWNAFIGARAGIPHVVNFFGVGNNTGFETYDRKYYRLRSQEYYGKLGVNRTYNKRHTVELSGFYETIKIKEDSKRFITDFKSEEAISGNMLNLERKHFIGADAGYHYVEINDPVLPTKGFRFSAGAAYTHNLTTPGNSFVRINSEAAAYLPLAKFISFAVRAGGSTNIGDAEFYQLNQLGSHDNLRGYRKYRFYGKSSFYNNNELRFMFDAHNKVFNGKYGFVAFLDNGRVWQPGEVSNTWHYGYGAGAFLSLFNRIILSGSLGISKEDQVLSFYFGFYF